MDSAAIQFISTSKSYGSVLALDDVNLSVKAGEIFGFLGPNGAGKTTAIRILFDLIRPSSGRAMVLGLDCQSQGVEARAQMGYLPGDLRLYENISGRDLIELFRSLRRPAPTQKEISALCERLAIDPSRSIGAYSKGNKQKLGVLLAVMHRPPVLVLDEPTSGLDPLMQEQVARLFEELAAGGHTVFFSSHVLPEVEKLCHRVAIIRKGRIVAVEDIAEIKGRSLHVIEVTFAAPVPDDAFAIPGVRELRRDGTLVHLEVRANIDAAIKAIARYAVIDIRTEQPSLEDNVLAFYEDRPAGAPAAEVTDAAS